MTLYRIEQYEEEDFWDSKNEEKVTGQTAYYLERKRDLSDFGISFSLTLICSLLVAAMSASFSYYGEITLLTATLMFFTPFSLWFLYIFLMNKFWPRVEVTEESFSSEAAANKYIEYMEGKK